MLQRGRELGAEVAQYFPKNPKSFRVRVFAPEALQAEAEKVTDLHIITVCHSPYVTNFSTPDPRLQETSINSIVNDLEIAGAYGTPYLVVHCGKHVGEGEETGRRLMVAAIDQVLARYQGQVMLLLENTAGQGSDLGRTTDDLLTIRSGLEQPERVGFCFDTCHAYAAGVLALERWEETCAELGREEFSRLVQVLHLNDSMTPFNSHRDRHALLGEGQIGPAGLERFLQAGLFGDIPVVIETPVEKEADYAGEITRARRWAGV